MAIACKTVVHFTSRIDINTAKIPHISITIRVSHIALLWPHSLLSQFHPLFNPWQPLIFSSFPLFFFFISRIVTLFWWLKCSSKVMTLRLPPLSPYFLIHCLTCSYLLCAWEGWLLGNIPQAPCSLTWVSHWRHCWKTEGEGEERRKRDLLCTPLPLTPHRCWRRRRRAITVITEERVPQMRKWTDTLASWAACLQGL